MTHTLTFKNFLEALESEGLETDSGFLNGQSATLTECIESLEDEDSEVHIFPQSCCGGDYVGNGLLAHSNADAIHRDYPLGTFVATEAHSVRELCICDEDGADYAALVDILRGLTDYPVYDEEHNGEVEQEAVQESWEQYARADIAARAGELLGLKDADLEDLADLCWQAGEIDPNHWSIEQCGASFDIERAGECFKVWLESVSSPVYSLLAEIEELREPQEDTFPADIYSRDRLEALI